MNPAPAASSGAPKPHIASFDKMSLNPKILRVRSSRLAEVDLDNLVFGETFSDHMFSMRYEDGRWGSPEILPYGPVPLPPASIALHYAQTVFEGMKAYRGADGAIRLFRPKRNAARLRASCERLCIPPIDDRVFVDALKALIAVDADWVPALPGYALYIRPVVFSTEDHIEVRPSRRYRFIVVTAPVGRYFTSGGGGLSLKVEEHYTRSPAEGGLGASKAAANYAGTILSSEGARREGFDQVLWLDGRERRYVEEAGLMNVFLKIAGRTVTPPIGDSILPGVTRDSLIALLRDRGVPVEERRIAIDEVLAAARAGTLEEMFACGTAAVVAPIANLAYRSEAIAPREAVPGPLTGALYEELTGIQFGRTADPHGWTEIVETG